MGLSWLWGKQELRTGLYAQGTWTGVKLTALPMYRCVSNLPNLTDLQISQV